MQLEWASGSLRAVEWKILSIRSNNNNKKETIGNKNVIIWLQEQLSSSLSSFIHLFILHNLRYMYLHLDHSKWGLALDERKNFFFLFQRQCYFFLIIIFLFIPMSNFIIIIINFIIFIVIFLPVHIDDDHNCGSIGHYY